MIDYIKKQDLIDFYNNNFPDLDDGVHWSRNDIIQNLDNIPSIKGCNDTISRQAVDTLVDELARTISDERCCLSRGRSTATIMQNILDLPSVNPQHTETEIQKMQELKQAEIQKAYEIGKTEKPNKWIPVSERLPEDYEVILFSTKTDRVFEGRYFADDTDRQWYSFRDETFAWNNVVTAWMPLPEPYRAESEVQNEKQIIRFK